MASGHKKLWEHGFGSLRSIGLLCSSMIRSDTAYCWFMSVNKIVKWKNVVSFVQILKIGNF
jgi:hypothetical protein